mmetsp:Transcript_48914/g.72692  ORF Transcript_48914/g.72692 Transcript_48914/m.72692 type:complete len:385 (+) Transcript_48914:435-1589(+)|eukprot:CAMPEP_0195513542 /NCGR_PEP_ID=MMETSP0794_2-20130614/5175_1 /TAXON_ID=515487 /ORGANISM="Stephanopyxis turris, Strain CCMP 815" /LENGTH=384 /DNA_ID=CAMNT_0040641585 /DNA_START=359 /DNA_END=1513 /DNA_ORIENTATION=+
MPGSATAAPASSTHEDPSIRSGWYSNVITFLMTASLTFSLLSSFDCQFVQVNIGFVPQNDGQTMIATSSSSDTVRVGLWSCEVFNSGLCVYFSDANQLGNDVFVKSAEYENPYSKLLLNGDTGWIVSRFSAIVGASFGLIAVVSVWLLNFNIIRLSMWSIELLLNSTGAAIVCEGLKFIMFFNIIPCNKEIWPQQEQQHEQQLLSTENYFHHAQSCSVDRGCYASIFACLCYLVSMILMLRFSVKPQVNSVLEGPTNIGQPGDDYSVSSASTFSRIFARTNRACYFNYRPKGAGFWTQDSKSSTSNDEGGGLKFPKSGFSRVISEGSNESNSTLGGKQQPAEIAEVNKNNRKEDLENLGCSFHSCSDYTTSEGFKSCISELIAD